MSRRDELNSYIARLQQRLRLGAWLRGACDLYGHGAHRHSRTGTAAQPFRLPVTWRRRSTSGTLRCARRSRGVRHCASACPPDADTCGA